MEYGEISLLVTTAAPAMASGGKSHSWVIPTMPSLNPRAATISVIEGSRHTIRGARGSSSGDPPAAPTTLALISGADVGAVARRASWGSADTPGNAGRVPRFYRHMLSTGICKNDTPTKTRSESSASSSIALLFPSPQYLYNYAPQTSRASDAYGWRLAK
eukprot:scaffold904_cov239-Pinguiococcus_pyrenoidosus.AAC.5